MKFNYSPGLKGYGIQGADGSIGIPGAAIYFTDFNPITDKIDIDYCIRNNYNLRNDLNHTKLPGNRSYYNGDVFISTIGKIYEIDISNNYTYIDTSARIGVADNFEPIEDNIATFDGYNRYHNIKADDGNKKEKLLIDTVQSNTPSLDYTSYPETIYGIEPKNFTRISYNNIGLDTSNGSINAFDIFSSARNPNENFKLAIIYDHDKNRFRIGTDTLDDDINLLFDVSSFIHNKKDNRFSKTTPTGSILSNNEINANILFSSAFDPSVGLTSSPRNTNGITLSWDISNTISNGDYDDINNACIVIRVKYNTPFISFPIEDENKTEFRINLDDTSGSVILNDLNPDVSYGSYLELELNGWIRHTNTIYF